MTALLSILYPHTTVANWCTFLPPGPLDLINTYTSNTVFYTFFYTLAGTGQIPSGARIQEVRFLISSGTFEPGIKQAEMRAIMSNGTVDSVVQVPTGASGSPPTTETLDVYGINQYVYGGGGTFTTNPYTNLPWTKADLQRIWAGYHARWHRPAGAAADWQRLSFNDYTVEVAYDIVPTLTVDLPVVARLGQVTFTINNAAPDAAVSRWAFTSSIGAAQRSSNVGALTWPGLIASPGIVTVRVEQNGETFDLMQPVDVTPRGWEWTAVGPRRDRRMFSFPSPPALGTRIGIAGLNLAFSFSDPVRIADDGPNHGFLYIDRISDTTRQPRDTTWFHYDITDDLNKNATFYKAQCGTWTPQNAGGIILNTTLLSNLEEHEFGTTLGHYQQYVTSLADPANNLGVVAEAIVGPPEQSAQACIARLRERVAEAALRVMSACSSRRAMSTPGTIRAVPRLVSWRSAVT